jgi:hypothetical protein
MNIRASEVRGPFEKFMDWRLLCQVVVLEVT